MQLENTLPISPHGSPNPGRAAKQELFVDLEELVLPEILLHERIFVSNDTRW